MGKPGVVNLSSLVDEVRRAVEEGGKGAAMLSQNPEIVMLRDPRIVGFIMSDEELGGTNLGQLTDLATRIGKSAGGPGGLVVHEGRIIVGFLPPAGGFGE